jgi:hypothetical protein
MKTSAKKSYDCVKSVRKERDRIANDTEGMTPKEIIDYFKKRKQNKTQGEEGEKKER